MSNLLSQDLTRLLRRPGEPRQPDGSTLGHCTECHRGVWLAQVDGYDREVFGLCARCKPTPAVMSESDHTAALKHYGAIITNLQSRSRR